MYPQGLSHPGAESIGLDEKGHKARHIFEVRPHGEVSQGVDSRLACPELKVQQLELITQDLVFKGHLITYPFDGRVKPHTGLNAYDQEVKGIRKSHENLHLSVFRSPVKVIIGKIETEG